MTDNPARRTPAASAERIPLSQLAAQRTRTHTPAALDRVTSPAQRHTQSQSFNSSV